MYEDRAEKPPLPVPARRTRELEAYGSSVSAPAEPAPMNVLAAVWRRRWAVLGCVVLSLIVGAIVLVRSPKRYGAQSQIYVQAAVPRIISDEYSSGSMSGDYLATQCQLITSSAILSQALQEPGVSDAKVLRGIENPIGFLKYAIQAEPTKTGQLIDVFCDASPNPDDAAILVNGVVQAYIDYQAKQHQSSAVQVANILQKEMETHQYDLTTEQNQMLTLRRNNPALSFQTQTSSPSLTRLSTLSQNLSDAQFRAEDLHLALSTAQANKTNIAELQQLVAEYQLSSLVPPSSLPQLAQLATQQKMTLDQLLDNYGKADRKVQHAQEALNRTQQDITDASKQLAQSCIDVIGTASNMVDQRVKQLQQALSVEQRATTGLSEIEAEYAQLSQAADRNERALDVLDDRLKDIRVTADVGPMSISVLETARPRLLPVWPVPSTILGESLVAGLLVGLGLALLLDKLDQRLRSVDEISAMLDAPILGVVPHVLRKALPSEVGREIRLRPRSATAEAFRTIRTAIYFGGADDRAVKTILLTSPSPGDGKSTCASNLAIAIAQAGRRVLLIDADCRRPAQHKTFGIEEGLGLAAILTGRASLDDAVCHTEIDRLDLLPCGPLPHSPAELLDSQTMLDLLTEAGGRYDQVIVDSPPVTLVSDARILAGSCDATVLVLRASRSTRRSTTLAWNALASVGANLIGVVVNDVINEKQGYAYYGYGRYGRAPTIADANEHSVDPPASPASNGKSVIVSSGEQH